MFLFVPECNHHGRTTYLALKGEVFDCTGIYFTVGSGFGPGTVHIVTACPAYGVPCKAYAAGCYCRYLHIVRAAMSVTVETVFDFSPSTLFVTAQIL